MSKIWGVFSRMGIGEPSPKSPIFTTHILASAREHKHCWTHMWYYLIAVLVDGRNKLFALFIQLKMHFNKTTNAQKQNIAQPLMSLITKKLSTNLINSK